ncbi:SlyX protein [Aliidiomarina taiwanensis]|uniref:SlyX protein n=1 Tax=Aliidiomarina taiwanensis TaxID=946228 RepID=A0A432WYN5_9GAMM|nr:SlyX family protein [Aliidiomarina taiwanensis]RUO38908.1 SlyX protein [Aliidiomarina taiwanensis]
MDKQLQALVQRIDDLESKLAFQDDTIDALDKLVQAQSSELQTLHKYIRLLAEKIQPEEDAEESPPFNLIDERPPHY